MSMGLLDKLRMMEAAKPAAKEAPPEPLPEESFHRLSRFPLTAFSKLSHVNRNNLRDIYGIELRREARPESLLFLDTETTGLSGGVGTIAFLIGAGYIEGNEFVVEQFLMRDYHEELHMLGSASRLMRGFQALVTFNGRSFDAPLLRSRLIMNRLDAGCLPAIHLDLLYPARRIWKLRLGSCSLSRLEDAVLGISREHDMPGAQVPQAYFGYLKDRDFEPMERILSHNCQDIVSLAQLFFQMCMLCDHPEEMSEPKDLYSMAKALDKSGAAERAMKCYRLSARGDMRGAAYSGMALREKRAGHTQSAVKLYTAMAARGEQPVYALEALAKISEHTLKDPARALAYTRQALLILSEPRLFDDEAVQEKRNALQYRYARLKKRLDSKEQA